ncbi:hypothetical protein NEF87_000232 [Candidatus Lokiarchaeum ossiferum]|uniref:CAAX prenyl protease 2/Lysostaphin resistance protein A-like domain-containing protein n=1 Tax=Candidatus Lokiarchaeum ossiferum TaxID=2951803 RepID=A0ABY6HM32_9ARCH|nr:hypothetical protein NEF87_000232 [Candidatus Lokiarchaeum sp. B-35]
MEDQTHIESNQLTSKDEQSFFKKILSIIEVLLVRFGIYSIVAHFILQYFFEGNYFQKWYIPYIIGFLWYLIPLLIITSFRRSFVSYGLNFANFRNQIDFSLNMILIMLIPSSIFLLITFLNIEHDSWLGSAILSLTFIMSIFIFLYSQKNNITKQSEIISNRKHISNILTLILIYGCPIFIGFFLGKLSWNLVSIVMWQLLFSGFGEEFFFRGYILGRLNQSFGKPYKISGISFGPGLIINALIFSLTHILNPTNYWLNHWEFIWSWGLYTFFGGILFSLMREKAKSIIPGGFSHGIDGVGEGFHSIFFA